MYTSCGDDGFRLHTQREVEAILELYPGTAELLLLAFELVAKHFADFKFGDVGVDVETNMQKCDGEVTREFIIHIDIPQPYDVSDGEASSLINDNYKRLDALLNGWVHETHMPTSVRHVASKISFLPNYYFAGACK